MASPLKALGALSKGVKDNQQEAAEAGTSIGMKMRNIADYKAAMQPTVPAPTAPTKPGKIDKTGAQKPYGSRAGEQRIDTKDMTKPLGSFKKGGVAKKTGMYKIHGSKKRPERVLSAKQTAKFEKSGGLAALSGKK